MAMRRFSAPTLIGARPLRQNKSVNNRRSIRRRSSGFPRQMRRSIQIASARRRSGACTCALAAQMLVFRKGSAGSRSSEIAARNTPRETSGSGAGEQLRIRTTVRSRTRTRWDRSWSTGQTYTSGHVEMQQRRDLLAIFVRRPHRAVR